MQIWVDADGVRWTEVIARIERTVGRLGEFEEWRSIRRRKDLGLSHSRVGSVGGHDPQSARIGCRERTARHGKCLIRIGKRQRLPSLPVVGAV